MSFRDNIVRRNKILVTFKGQKVKACGKKEATKTIFEDNLGENILNIDFFSSVTGAWK